MGVALPVLTGLAACGPVSVAQAERSCLDDARLAAGPRTHIAVGIGSDGHSVRPSGGVAVELSGDYVMGRDPAEVFDRCVLRRSGEMPTRPLAEQPGWRG
ncbi:hypothetical protein [uncultured Paracoccus sp.]|uniref:hypothetical protein n=1 Tax=uncultured Paracoccus sp. TaxID=189685 RepID=UPI002637CD06|nr:hypothetical protein [uncultured Paracoccus sp.]